VGVTVFRYVDLSHAHSWLVTIEKNVRGRGNAPFCIEVIEKYLVIVTHGICCASITHYHVMYAPNVLKHIVEYLVTFPVC